jgi:hypothetical protein
MRRAAPFRVCALSTLLLASGCQHLPTEFPFAVTDDCNVQRVAGGSSMDDGPSSAPERVHVASADILLAQTSRGAAGSVGAGGSRDTPTRLPDSPRRPSRGGGLFGLGGIGIGIGLPEVAPAAQPDIVQQLAQSGPQFPSAFSMSCVPVHAFVRGGWPMVVDYQPGRDTDVVVEIHLPDRRPSRIELDGAPRRQLVQFDLPALSDQPQVALVLVRATKRGGGAGELKLYGLGAGPKAVGSVAIDQVNFRPGSIRVSRKQQASYSFFSRTDFSRTVVEILRVQRVAEEVRVSLARTAPLGLVVNRGTWVGKEQPLTWDGRDDSERVSGGPHLLQVRAWLDAQSEHDWVAAWSPNTVLVAE